VYIVSRADTVSSVLVSYSKISPWHQGLKRVEPNSVIHPGPLTYVLPRTLPTLLQQWQFTVLHQERFSIESNLA
jgi:hypothetical protein